MAHADSTIPRPILLVHGAWHGAWCWSALQAELDRRGLPSHAIDLPGHGSSLAPFGGLHDDANHVSATLDHLRQSGHKEHTGGKDEYADSGFVLVGHSYGGAVITQAALNQSIGARAKIAHLVYVTAFALNPNESVATALRALSEETKADSTAETTAAENLLQRAVRPKPDGSSTLDPDLAAEVLYGDCTAPEAAAAIRRLCPQPGATMTERVTERVTESVTESVTDRAPETVSDKTAESAGEDPRKTTPSTYVKCLRDRAVDPAHQEIMARRCDHSIELDTDHSPFMSQTAALADILERIARRP
jgi:pimeloyl-ACP methyl ester carboxylesterase